MFKITPCCDACGEPLRVKRVSIYGEDVEVVESARTKVIDTTNLLPHLCKNCALKIDNSLLEFKLSVLNQTK